MGGPIPGSQGDTDDDTGSGAERRRAPRWHTDLPGQVEIQGLRMRLGCRVLDMSARGARIELSQWSPRVGSAQDLPDIIVLSLPLDRVDVAGAVRWRRGKTFGIEFASAFRPCPAASLQ